MPPPPLPKGYTLAPPLPPGYAPMDARTPPFAAPPSSNAPEESTPLSVAGNFLKGAVINTVKGAYDTAKRTFVAPELTGQEQRPEDYLVRAATGGMNVGPMLREMVGAHVDQAKQAFQAAKGGNYLEAAGHGVAALTPLVGPAAAGIGERGGEAAAAGDYNKVAEEAGNAAALIAPVVAKEMSVPGAQAATDTLKQSAVKGYGQVLNATTKGNKLRSAEVVPGLIERGTTALTLKGLRGQAQANLQSFGQAIDDAWTGLPANATVDAQKVLSRIADVGEAEHMIADASGKLVPKGPQAAAALERLGELQNTIASVAEDVNGIPVIPAAKLRQLRQYFDKVSADAGRFDGKNLADRSTAAAHGVAADAIRGELAAEFPDISKINKEYTFWKDVDRVAGDTILRREGQAKPLGRKIVEGAGAAAGYGSGGVGGAILGKYALSAFEAATTSPAWRTVSAVLKDRLADAIAKGHRGPAESIINRITAEIAAEEGQKKK